MSGLKIFQVRGKLDHLLKARQGIFGGGAQNKPGKVAVNQKIALPGAHQGDPHKRGRLQTFQGLLSR